MSKATHLVVVGSSGKAKVVPNDYWNRQMHSWIIIHKGSQQECDDVAAGYNLFQDEER